MSPIGILSTVFSFLVEVVQGLRDCPLLAYSECFSGGTLVQTPGAGYGEKGGGEARWEAGSGPGSQLLSAPNSLLGDLYQKDGGVFETHARRHKIVPFQPDNPNSTPVEKPRPGPRGYSLALRTGRSSLAGSWRRVARAYLCPLCPADPTGATPAAACPSGGFPLLQTSTPRDFPVSSSLLRGRGGAWRDWSPHSCLASGRAPPPSRVPAHFGRRRGHENKQAGPAE